MTKYTMADVYSTKKNGLKAASVFCCGGGSSIGYKLAGVDVVAGCDIDETAEWHYRKNLNPSFFFGSGIKEIIKKTPDCFYGLDILDGSPPCSTFSMSGSREDSWGENKKFREGQHEQVLSDLFFDFIELAKKTQPKIIIAENVKGLILGNAKGYAKMIKKNLQDAGYTSQLFLLNAAFFGVPQKRERVFFICQRRDFYKKQIEIIPAGEPISCLEACADLQDLTAEETKATLPKKTALRFYDKTKKGSSFSTVSEKGSYFNWIRLDDKKPSNTLASTALLSGTVYHWDKMRTLTTREIIRLGGFPDDYKFRSEKDLKYLVGMSVPPKQTMNIARQIIAQCLS
jgi:DNA (cytosine-5)-methyltransferase 1